MMIFFNNLGNSWVAKGIFTALALSMVAFWGLGGLSNNNQFADDAIIVGNRKVSANELLTAFNREHQNLSQMLGGQYVSPQKAMQMGLGEQVVQQQVSKLLNEQIKEDLGLTASNAAVQKYVEHHPAFADTLGKFDKNLFYAYLQKNKMSEAQLADKLQDELAMQHLGYALKGIAYAPSLLTETTYRYRNEARDIKAVIIDTDKINIDANPSEDELKEYYEAYSDQFMAPEYREFKVIRLTPDLMLSRVILSEDEIEDAFAAQKEQYVVPEKRSVSQMRFETEEEAKTVLKELTAKNFTDKAFEKLNQTPDQTDFGFVARNELLEEMVEPVFTAKKGDIIGPIHSPVGYHVMLVRDIQDAQTPKDDVIRANIKEQLALNKTYETLYETVKQVEDILGSGQTLDDAAKQLNLPILTIEATDIAGKFASGNSLEDSINHQEMIQNIFTLQKGDTTPMFENGTGYLVAQVTAIHPVHQKEFSEVRHDVEKIWMTEQKKEKAPKVAETLLAEIKAGKEVKEKTSLGTFPIIHVTKMVRNAPKDLPIEAIDAIFKQKEGIQNAAIIPTRNGNLIAVTERISYPDIAKDDEISKTERANLQVQIGDDLMSNIIAAYADHIGVDINHDVIQKAFSIYMKNAE